MKLKCTCKDCDITLDLEISQLIGMCRWCRMDLEPHWDDTDWFDDYQMNLDWDVKE